MQRVLGAGEISVDDLRAVTGQVLRCNVAPLQQLLCDGEDKWESTVATVEKRGEYVESSVFAVVAFVLYKLCRERCAVHVHVDYDQHSEMSPEVYSFPPRAGSVHAECGWGDAVWPVEAEGVLPRVPEDVLRAVGGELHMYVLHQAEPVLHFDLLLPGGEEELEGEERSWAHVAAGERKGEWVVVEEEEKAEETLQEVPSEQEEQFLWEAASDEPEDEQHTTQGQEKITTEEIAQKRAGREARMREYLQRAAELEKTTPSEPDSTFSNARVHATTLSTPNTHRVHATAPTASATKTITKNDDTKTDTTLTNNNNDVNNNILLQLLQHHIQQQRATSKRVERALALELLAAQTRKHRAALTHVEDVLCDMLAE